MTAKAKTVDELIAEARNRISVARGIQRISLEFGVGNMERLLNEIEALRQELARVQQLPELEWAEAMAGIMGQLAAASRDGKRDYAMAAKKYLEAGKTYVNRLRAKAEKLTAYVKNVEDVAICPECGMSLLSDHDLDCKYWGKPVPGTH